MANITLVPGDKIKLMHEDIYGLVISDEEILMLGIDSKNNYAEKKNHPKQGTYSFVKSSSVPKDMKLAFHAIQVAFNLPSRPAPTVI